MAAMNFEKGSKEYQILQSFAIIVQRFYISDSTDEFWDEYLETIDKFLKYFDDPFCTYLATALTRYLTDKYQNKLGGNGENEEDHEH